MAEAILKRASGLSIVLGILMIIAGIIAMFAPWEAGLVITMVVGWSAIFNGVAQIIFGFRTHGGWHVILEVLLGIIYIIAGIYLLMHPIGGLAGIDADPGLVPVGVRRLRARAGLPDQAAQRLGMGAV